MTISGMHSLNLNIEKMISVANGNVNFAKLLNKATKFDG